MGGRERLLHQGRLDDPVRVSISRCRIFCLFSFRKHTMKATESRVRAVAGSKRDDGEGSLLHFSFSPQYSRSHAGLPKAAAWGKGPAVPVAASPPTTTQPLAASTSRPTRRGAGGVRQGRNAPVSGTTPTTETRTSSTRDRKGTPTKTPAQAPSSRPATPSSALLPPRPSTPADTKVQRTKKEPRAVPQPSPSPAPSVAADSDLGSGSQDVTPASPAIRPRSTDSVISSTPSVPPGLPAIPPGLSGPPGIHAPSRPPRVDTASPQTPLLASQSSYQMSTAARALLEDVKQRREMPPPVAAVVPPFPDFDRTLEVLNGKDGGSGFSFNLDPKLAGPDSDANVELLPDFEAEAKTPFHGTYVDAFPALRTPGSPGSAAFMVPPGLQYPHNPSRSIYDPLSVRPPIAPLERQSTGGSSYLGSFNPFADAGEDSPSPGSRYSPLDDDPSRKVSRFGFARGRQGSTATSSPLHTSSPLANSASEGHSFYNSSEASPSQPAQSPMPQWGPYYSVDGSATSSPLVQHAQAQPVYNQQHSRFQPFDSGVSEAQLRDFIQSSRDRAGSATGVLNTPAGMRLLFV